MIETPPVKAATILKVAGFAALLAVGSGCGMALKLADASSTSSQLVSGGSSALVGGTQIDLEASIERATQRPKTGTVTLRLRSAADTWPVGVRPATVAFRPQTGGYYFNYIDFDPNGAVTRITRARASNVRLEVSTNMMTIQFQIQLIGSKTYQLGVYLQDGANKRIPLGVQSVPAL
jgi:hypothetical protein